MEIIGMNAEIVQNETGIPSSVEEHKKEVLDLFLQDNTLCIVMDEQKSISKSDQLTLLALKKLETEGVLSSITNRFGETSFYATENPFFIEKDFKLNLDTLSRIADLYNSVMKSITLVEVPDLSALDITSVHIDALIGVVGLLINPSSEGDNEAGKRIPETEDAGEGSFFSID